MVLAHLIVFAPTDTKDQVRSFTHLEDISVQARLPGWKCHACCIHIPYLQFNYSCG